MTSSRPAAWQPPTTAPIEVPTMTSGSMPFASRVRSTPIWAKPRAPPPPSASPMVGRTDARAGASDVASAPRSPFRSRPWPSKTKFALPLPAMITLRRRRYKTVAALSLSCGEGGQRAIADIAAELSRRPLAPAFGPRHFEHRFDHRVFVIAAARDRLHGGGIEAAVLDKAVVNVDADGLAE